MSTILRCLDFGVYDVRRTRERYDGTVRLLKLPVAGWELVWRPADPGKAVLGKAVEGFDTFQDAKVWLLSAAGEAWLDRLPRAEETR